MVLQQQQLISMLQNQQTQQRSEEESKIQLLQLQISQQQKLIESIKEQKVCLLFILLILVDENFWIQWDPADLSLLSVSEFWSCLTRISWWKLRGLFGETETGK